MSTLLAVLDADALVPILLCDLLLSAFDEDLYRPVVTATILNETERTLVHSFTHLDPVALRGRVAQAAAALSLHTHDEGDVNAAAVAAVTARTATAPQRRRSRRRPSRHLARTAGEDDAYLVEAVQFSAYDPLGGDAPLRTSGRWAVGDPIRYEGRTGS